MYNTSYPCSANVVSSGTNPNMRNFLMYGMPLQNIPPCVPKKKQCPTEDQLRRKQKETKQKMESVKTLIKLEKEKLRSLQLHLDIEKLKYYEILQELKNPMITAHKSCPHYKK